jgi:quinol monooxygenase YgiN
MNEKLLTVVAEMIANTGKEEELKRELLALLGPTRQEEGCVEYVLHHNLEEPRRFLFYENWTSRELLERHLMSSHLRAFLAKAAEHVLLEEVPRISMLERIEPE